MGIIGALIKKNNSGIIGVKFEKGASPIKVQSLSERPRADKPGYNGRARSHGHIGQCNGQPVELSFSADTESESNSSSSSSTKTVSLLDRLLHQHTYIF